MLNTLRRGPTSATTALFSNSLCSQCVRIIRPQIAPKSIQRTIYPLSSRQFATSSKWRQSAPATVAREEEDAIEGELEQEVHAEKPPSDVQIDQATRHGPVTKFKDLSARGLVCQTVVETLTQDMRLETMTQVQSLTLNESLKGTDM